jgi:hypothetical protein
VCNAYITEFENTDKSDATVITHLAKGTLAEWKKVKQGEESYVNINDYFLKDYDQRYAAQLAD